MQANSVPLGQEDLHGRLRLGGDVEVQLADGGPVEGGARIHEASSGSLDTDSRISGGDDGAVVGGPGRGDGLRRGDGGLGQESDEGEEGSHGSWYPARCGPGDRDSLRFPQVVSGERRHAPGGPAP